MRLIDADDIDYESIDSSDTNRYEYYYGTGIMAVRKEDIDAMPTIEQPDQRWVPTSKKLPDELAEVNVTWENTEPEPYYDFVKGHCFTGTAVYFRGRWYWYSAVCVDYLREYGFSPNDEMDDAIKVLAWMPLPEPYKENKDERD